MGSCKTSAPRCEFPLWQNHADVWVVVDPADYQELLSALSAPSSSYSSSSSLSLRRRLAWKAFQHTASYDSLVAEWMWGRLGTELQQEKEESESKQGMMPVTRGGCCLMSQVVVSVSCSTILSAQAMNLCVPAAFSPPPSLSLPLSLSASLRYGENPHQQAAFYTDDSLAAQGRGGIATAQQFHGKVSTGRAEKAMGARRGWNPALLRLTVSLFILRTRPGS